MGSDGLPGLRQTHGVEVLFADDPTLMAVDLDVEPNLARIGHPEADVVLVHAPGDRSLRFEVVNLRIRLDHNVLGSKSIFGFGEESHESQLTATRWICLDLVPAPDGLALGSQARRLGADTSLNPVDHRAVNDADTSRPHAEFQHIMRYRRQLLPAEHGAWLMAFDLFTQERAICPQGSTQRGEFAIY